MESLKLFWTALLATILCLTSCSHGDDEPIGPTFHPEDGKSEITMDANIIDNGLVFSYEQGEQSVSFSTKESWTISIATTTSGGAWCAVSATNGSKGDATVKFSVTENTDYDNRSVSVTIKSGTASKTFTIAQKSKEALLLTNDKYEVCQEGDTIEIEVKANIEYQMEISEMDKSWITESSSRGLTAYKHFLVIAMNEENEKREGEVYFKSGDKVETVRIYQSGSAILLLSKHECSVGYGGDTVSVDIKSNVEFGVQMPEVDWITDEAAIRGLSSHTLKYLVLPNDTDESRTAEIVFYDKNGDLKDTLIITQLQKDMIVVSQKTYDVVSEGDTINVELLPNVNVEVTTPGVDWIIPTTPDTSNENTLSFIITGNDSDEERSGIIVITDLDKQLSDTITIKQDKKQDNIPYLTFTADAEQTLSMTKAVETLEYSVNGGEWTELGTATVTFGGNNGNLRLRGKNSKGTANSYEDYSKFKFTTTSPVACTGDIRTLLDYENYSTVDTENAKFCNLFSWCRALKSSPELPSMELSEYCYYGMFEETEIAVAPKLPATILAEKCYSRMFYSCGRLIQAPELPATTLAKGCYDSMFRFSGFEKAPELPATTLAEECYTDMFANSSLTQAAELPATTLAKNCYSGMFGYCSHLVQAPKLPATALAENCYGSMFLNCTSLIQAPELPATTLAETCYSGMFWGCKSLVQAPKLPAKTLKFGCYASMLRECISLTQAPELPAAKMAERCYTFMFLGCSGLTHAPELPATTLAEACYLGMFQDCTSLVQAPQLPAKVANVDCYNGMFENCTSLTKAPELGATTLWGGCYVEMFKGCSKLNDITMLAPIDLSGDNPEMWFGNWVDGVAAKGTFTKLKVVKTLPSGKHGIPKGWTVKNK